MKKTCKKSKAAVIRRTGWPERFIEHYRRTGNVTQSAEAVGVSRQSVYARAEVNEEFAQQMSHASEEAADRLEQEAFRRGVEGVEEPVYQQGAKVGTIRRYSDRMLEILLKARRPLQFRENRHIEHAGAVAGGGLTINLKPASPFDLSNLSTEELEYLRATLQKLRSTAPLGEHPPRAHLDGNRKLSATKYLERRDDSGRD